jgi:hypothetical protein
MIGRNSVSEQRRLFSFILGMMLILSPLLIGISIQGPDAGAGSVGHTVGDLEINILTDYGRILRPLDWNGAQTVQDATTTLTFIGLVIDHDNYDHTPGSENIADCFNSNGPLHADDFRTVKTITMIINDGTTLKSFGSFQNKGVGTGYPDDILINQTCWTFLNKDWAILQWTLVNVKSPASDLTNVRVGLEVAISKLGSRYGLGGELVDGGDDVDGYDLGNDVYWAQDTTDGTTIGFGSAIVTDPITHYYAEDYHAEYHNASDPSDPDPKYYVNFFGNDTWLNQRLIAPSATATKGINPGNITATVGWDCFDIPIGESRTVTLVIAINDTYSNMITAIKDAQYYYKNVATNFVLTEFSDNQIGTQQVEIYSNGCEITDLMAEGYKISVDGGLTFLPGYWNPQIIPTYGYSVFQVTGSPIPPEGGTVGLYRDLGGGNIKLIDEVAFGLEGVAPDPLDGESTARYWDDSIAGYNDDWTRGEPPSWGAQNDVPPINHSSYVILNEIMFNPMIIPDGSYVVIINKNPVHSVYIGNYHLVCDDVYLLPLFPGVPGGFDGWLNPLEKIIIKYGDDPVSDAFFCSMDSVGDNVYLYDNSGRLLDMAGWSSSHEQGKSMRRVPDGNGTHEGYNDPSSIAAGWVFNCTPIPPPPPPPPPTPSPPTGLHSKLVANGKNILLSWNASIDDGKNENDITGYTIYKSSTGVNGTYNFTAWVPANGFVSYAWMDVNAGDGDWNNYFYIVRANDTLNNEEQNDNKAGKFVNYLADDWNLFSVPLVQIDASKEYVLQTIEGNYVILQGYHAGKSRPWLHWHKGKPNYFNDVIEINHKEGYYIKMLIPDHLVVAGRVPAVSQIPLKTGWNLIGYPCLIKKTVEETLSSIDGKYNIVEYYDTSKDKEIRLAPNDYMKPGLGYWIHVKEDCILIM